MGNREWSGNSQWWSGGIGGNMILLLLKLLGDTFANAEHIDPAILCVQNASSSKSDLLCEKNFLHKVVKEFALCGHSSNLGNL
ncbi:hypothetical protein BEN30_16315 [Magnetovibrio blakemorei]|uniref:Uncharacterized protein n=1 Tax=Magnetovibrio blakemorei TaxID=28181 RepID=A0A1E5Q3T7_9PROT|nr:hypothetical protein BEN30_16315 [Magnetovibrio blakemorei]